MKKWINILLKFGKVRITFFVAISCALGFILASGKLSYEMLIPLLGVFLLSSGASAFNQWQEHNLDAKMQRTKNRPIPSGQLNLKNGFFIALSLTVLGLVILSFTGNMIAFALGIFAIFWYNIIYTPLKRKTSLAFLPGALIGSISPAIGWVSGGGSTFNPQLYALALFFFIWQIPHFWLLLLIYEKDYRNAGFPVLTDIFNRNQLSQMTFIWISAMSVSSILILFLGFSQNNSSFVLRELPLLFIGIILLWRTKNLLKQNNIILSQSVNSIYKFAFLDINFYVLAVTILLSFNKLFSSF
ncbi:MAG: protoheme IX farnesyltransferase [FCB group bacterium]|jgi:protoheme IX farnesyltransferase